MKNMINKGDIGAKPYLNSPIKNLIEK